MGSWAERTCGKVVAGRPSEVTDCGLGQTELQLAGKAAAGRLDNRLCNPGLQHREIKPQTTG